MRLMETIAVGFDGSPDAKAAVRWALNLALAVDARVVVVHAKGMFGRFGAEDATKELDVSIRQLCDDCGIESTRVRLHTAEGDACSVLLRMAEDPIAADLLVVGSRGQGKHPGLLLGSTSLELAEHATVPLVIVPSL
jgi:nucleotide-binding universal stress UspA family protein